MRYTAVLLVTSYAGHDQVRAAHRAALHKAELQRFNVVRVFLLADIPGEEKFITQQTVDDEQNLFNDIVQGTTHSHIFLRTSCAHGALQ